VKIYLGCTDFWEAGFRDESCCDSCHEDEWLGYSMIEEYEDSDFPKGKYPKPLSVEIILCCGMSRSVGEITREKVARALQAHRKRVAIRGRDDENRD